MERDRRIRLKLKPKWLQSSVRKNATRGALLTGARCGLAPGTGDACRCVRAKRPQQQDQQKARERPTGSFYREE